MKSTIKGELLDLIEKEGNISKGKGESLRLCDKEDKLHLFDWNLQMEKVLS